MAVRQQGGVRPQKVARKDGGSSPGLTNGFGRPQAAPLEPRLVIYRMGTPPPHLGPGKRECQAKQTQRPAEEERQLA